MQYSNAPMTFVSEVESGVILTGLPDFELAHGAGMVADTQRFKMLVPNEDDAPERRRIYGVTALSLDYEGSATFRTATFGIQSPEFISQVDALGTSKIIEVGTVSDRTPRVASVITSKVFLSGYFEKLQERGRCTLGGTIIQAGDQEGTLAIRPFISTAFDELLEKQTHSRLGRAGSGIRVALSPKAREVRKNMEERGWTDHKATQKLGLYALVTSSAKKRGGPVVVERPFIAQI